MSTVEVTWRCTRPNSELHARFCERLMRQAAESKGLDMAVVRHGIHSTTRSGRKWVADRPHITGDVMDSQMTVRYSLHYYVDPNNLVELPDTPDQPNPEFWDYPF